MLFPFSGPKANAVDRQKLAVVVGVVVVVLALAISGGLGAFDGVGGGRDAPSPSDRSGSSNDRGGSGGDAADEGDDTGGQQQRPFGLRIESVESCGQTCRDVTATLINQQDRRATGVTVRMRVHTGKGTDGDVVWEGNQEVGALAAGGSHTETRRIELGYFEALAVQRADGWITIVLTIRTDRQTVTFRERRDVA